MSAVSLRRAVTPLGLGAGILFAWPFVFSSVYDHRVFALAGIYALLTIGYQFIFGHAGALALTQGAFFGIGAYAAAILGVRFGWSLELTAISAILLTVTVASIVALPVLRLESHYFALATLGVSQVAWLIAINWESLTGGANGLAGIPGLSIAGLSAAQGLKMTALVWGFVVIGGAVGWQVTRGLYGQALRLLRADDIAAAACGIDGPRLRLVCFLLSAGYGGLAGALYAHALRVVSTETLEFHVMVACLAMAVIGGRARVAGAVIGAVLLVHLPEWLRDLDGYYLIAYGVLLLAMIVLAPDGLIGLVERGWSRVLPSLPPTPPAPVPMPERARERRDVPALAVVDVSKRFGGVNAVAGVSLDVKAGEILGLIGPNGSGKTTLLNIVSGLEAPDRGRIAIGGNEVDNLAAFRLARSGVARAFQTPRLVEDMSTLDNVATARAWRLTGGLLSALSLRHVAHANERARGEAFGLLESLGIAQHSARPCGELPIAVRRRIEIARALALEPFLLLLDEPAAGLAAEERDDLARRLVALARAGRALLIVEHDMSFLLPIADRVACLEEGRVIALGPPDMVARHPAVIAAYLGATRAGGAV
ncbi:MAG TPA: ATP-binding cassette domain-containing protein [Alphaproteobacteria bacterium]|nr:ATP-binding cassette domain-containing protein [Alphaproteobacteria bacterium]